MQWSGCDRPWVAFLSASGYEDFEIVELRRVLRQGGSLHVRGHFRTAKAAMANPTTPAGNSSFASMSCT